MVIVEVFGTIFILIAIGHGVKTAVQVRKYKKNREKNRKNYTSISLPYKDNDISLSSALEIKKDKSSILELSKLPEKCNYEKEGNSSLEYDLKEESIDKKYSGIEEKTWIETMQKVASQLTTEKSREFIAKREEIINEKMRKIEEREYESEVGLMKENEDYDDDDWNMILGNSC